MKAIKVMSVFALSLALASAPAWSAEAKKPAESKKPCCEATVEAGKACKNACCKKAAEKGKVCKKCHPQAKKKAVKKSKD